MFKKNSLQKWKETKKGSDETSNIEEPKPVKKKKEKAKEKPKTSKSKSLDFFKNLLFAGIAALLIKSFLIETSKVPTPSMENTILSW